MLLTGALLFLGLGHRSGRVPYLGRLAGFSERVSGLPGWVALPSAIATISLLVALLGFLWDVSIHIDEGRDEGPLANLAHYPILGGLFGIFTAGFLACVLPLERPSRSAIRIVGDWYAPLGGVIVASCGMFALIGFPLDDVWHRLFGQDVTLWGPDPPDADRRRGDDPDRARDPDGRGRPQQASRRHGDDSRRSFSGFAASRSAAGS